MTTRKSALSLPARTPAFVPREVGAAELGISPETWDRWVSEEILPPAAPGLPASTRILLIGDAYETGEFRRARAKKALNIGINTKSKLVAIAAIAKELKISRREAAKLFAAMMAKHRQVSDIFCSDAGASLMRIDAAITLQAVQHAQAQGIAVSRARFTPCQRHMRTDGRDHEGCL